GTDYLHTRADHTVPSDHHRSGERGRRRNLASSTHPDSFGDLSLEPVPIYFTTENRAIDFQIVVHLQDVSAVAPYLAGEHRLPIPAQLGKQLFFDVVVDPRFDQGQNRRIEDIDARRHRSVLLAARKVADRDPLDTVPLPNPP